MSVAAEPRTPMPAEAAPIAAWCRYLRPRSGPAVVGVALLFLSWTTLPRRPTAGTDPSWQGALHMAAGSGLTWGRDLIYTYGPLGFLEVPGYWTTATGMLAVLYHAATAFSLVLALWLIGRRSFGAVGAALIVLVVVPFISYQLLAVTFVWTVWVLTEQRSERAIWAYVVGMGALGGLDLLGKISTGASIVAVGFVAILLLGGIGRRLGVWAAIVVVSLLVGWLATGQPLGALPDYLVNSGRVVSGYSEAMGLDITVLAWQYTAALAVLLIGLWAILSSEALASWSRRAGLGAMWILFALLTFKSAFVRHDDHARLYFDGLLAVLVVLPWTAARRGFGLAAVLLPIFALMAAQNRTLTDIVSPVKNVQAAWTDLTSVARHGLQAQFEREGRIRVQQAEAMEPQILAALRGRTVHVAPDEVAAAWAYGLKWRPLPLFQAYEAYTSKLDQLNADRLAGKDAPERILLRNQLAADGRNSAWESPAAVREMLCRYVPVARQARRWIVLARGRTRCGAPRLIGSAQTGWDGAVRVPQPQQGGMVYMRISGAQVSGFERLRTTFFKARQRLIVLDGSKVYRLVPGTAGDGLVLRIPASLRGFAPFVQSPNPQTVAVAKEAAKPGSGHLRFDFYEAPVRP